MNTSILNEEDYKNGLQNIVNDTVQEFCDILNKRILWDLIKVRIKEFSIKYSIKKSQNSNNEMKLLEEKISLLESQITINTINLQELCEERAVCKRNLEDIY